MTASRLDNSTPTQRYGTIMALSDLGAADGEEPKLVNLFGKSWKRIANHLDQAEECLGL
jgi:hypothetical protein